MLREYVSAGGPVMLAVIALWVVVLAAVLDRCLYALGRAARRPLARVRALARAGRPDRAAALLGAERRRASRALERIDAVSQIAPSVGLFGTVLGLAQSLFARGADLELAAPEVFAGGLATALFTTVGGLVVFLFGQGFLIAWREWEAHGERGLPRELLEDAS